MTSAFFGRARWAGALVALALLTSCAAEPIPVPRGANAPCSDLAYQGFPKLEPDLRNSFFVCHKGLALQYAAPLRSALWVTEHLQAVKLDENKVKRDRQQFRPDMVLPEGLTPAPERFTNTGYDRGHLAPAADFKENPAGMSHSFYTSNIVPQVPENNRGIWAKLEKNVRAWAQQKGEVYVVTGPVFYANGKIGTPVGWLAFTKGKPQYVIQEYTRPEEEVDPNDPEKKKKKRRAHPPRKPPITGIAVPSHLYKVIYDPKANTAIAFVVPNAAVPESALAQYATTVAEVERVTGLRFFPNLPFQEQASLKTQVNPQAWLISQ